MAPWSGWACTCPSDAALPRECFWRITATRAILATGALERPIAFPLNDRPGIMMAGAVQTYLNRFGVASGRRVTLYANNDAARATARQLMAAGVKVAAILDSRVDASAVEDCPVYLGAQILETHGRHGLTRPYRGQPCRWPFQAGDGLSGHVGRLEPHPAPDRPYERPPALGRRHRRLRAQ